MFRFSSSVAKVAARHAYARMVEGAALTDVSKMRYQAVFLMGTGGSGKTYASHKWMKFMPGGGSEGYTDREVWEEKVKEKMTEQERNLSNLNFEAARSRLEDLGFKIDLVDPQNAKIPFRLYTYTEDNQEIEVDPEDYKNLPEEVVESLAKVRPDIENITEVIFGTPIHELPTYWRQVNPDLYKEELAGYLEKQPGYVHEMSSEMSKAYFEGVLETGDPLMVDGTGANIRKMVSWVQKAQQAGYKVSVVYVYVPLTISMIRNATRARNVAIPSLIKQFFAISKNYAKLRGLADKAHFIDNRNDSADIKKYKDQSEKINGFVEKSSGGKYQNLFELIRDVAPKELRDYGWLLEGAGSAPMSDRQKEIERIREKKDITRRYAKAELAELYKSTLKLAGLTPMFGEVFWPSGS